MITLGRKAGEKTRSREADFSVGRGFIGLQNLPIAPGTHAKSRAREQKSALGAGLVLSLSDLLRFSCLADQSGPRRADLHDLGERRSHDHAQQPRGVRPRGRWHWSWQCQRVRVLGRRMGGCAPE